MWTCGLGGSRTVPCHRQALNSVSDVSSSGRPLRPHAWPAANPFRQLNGAPTAARATPAADAASALSSGLHKAPAPRARTPPRTSFVGSAAAAAPPATDGGMVAGGMLVSDASKAAGCLLGAMCGNVLAAPHQNDRSYQVTRMRADGVTDFWRYDMSRRPVAYGQYTGDFLGLLAVAVSLSEHKTADADQLLEAVAACYSPEQRRYSSYDALVLQALLSGSDPGAVASLAEQYLAVATQRFAGTSSDRPEREPYGPTDYNAAARVAPIGLVYRHASSEVLLQAARALCEFTHPTPLGLDAAHVLAAAVAWLARQQPGSIDATPGALLQHLIMDVAVTTDMLAKLRLLRECLFQVDEVTSWRSFYSGPQWHELLRVLNACSFHGYATAGSEAVAVALWALTTNWRRPEQAMVVAASFGGNAPAITQMVGAMAGALYGDAWLPARWREGLENGELGREEVEALAEELAGLRCTSVGLPEGGEGEDSQEGGDDARVGEGEGEAGAPST